MSMAPTTKSDGFFAHIFYVLRGNPITALAFILLAFFIVCALFGPLIVPYDPLASNTSNALKPPSSDHWFGTDNLGRDVFSRVIVATRLDLLISVSAVALSFVIGSILGSIAGYWGGWLDAILNRLLDTIMAFPLLFWPWALLPRLETLSKTLSMQQP